MKNQKWTTGIFILCICVIGIGLSLIFRKSAEELQEAQADSEPDLSAVREWEEDEWEEDALEIFTMEEYLDFVTSVNAGNTYAGRCVDLYTDLDFAGVSEEIVIGAEDTSSYRFEGIFNGHAHRIRNLALTSETEAGLFRNLDGTVCNLMIESGYFSGAYCGAITANPTGNARILNCISLAEIQGDTCDGLRGMQAGTVQNCYVPSMTVDAETLNQGLGGLGGTSGVSSWYFWEMSEGMPVLSDREADTMEILRTDLEVDEERLTFYAYYSAQEDEWCFALPDRYAEKELELEILFSGGESLCIRRRAGEERVYFERDSISYQVRFLESGQIPSVFVETHIGNSLEYLHEDKKHELNGEIRLLDEDGKWSLEREYGEISGHGNDSWNVAKKSYNLTFDSEVDLLDMGEAENYVLLAGYRDNSLLAYKVTNDLSKEVGMAFAPETRFIQLYIDGTYMGMYCLTEKIEIGRNRFDIQDLEEQTGALNSCALKEYERTEWKSDTTAERRIWFGLDAVPKDVTGGYILEYDRMDFDPVKSRFVSKRNLSLVLRSMPYASVEQVNYIADYWQDFEDALYAEDGFNEKGVHYSEYIDMESFADQWLFYELNMENSLTSSIYFYKESELTGDGLLHASYPWDMEHSLTRGSYAAYSWFATSRTEKDSYWNQFYRHEDFAALVYQEWMEKFLPAIEKALDPDTEEDPDGISSLDWYLERYEKAGKVNSSRWETCIYEEKLEKIRSIYLRRKDFLTKALSVYDSPYAYFYEEDDVFYGVLPSGEEEEITWNEKDSIK